METRKAGRHDRAGRGGGRHVQVFASPLGPLVLYGDGHVLTALDYGTAQPPPAAADKPSPLAEQALAALQSYFSGPHGPAQADGLMAALPLAPAGTPFQRRVWASLRAIPPGQTRTYGELARELGTSARAVGQACRTNPLAILVPCHRVVAAHGLGGYSGAVQGQELERKTWLLRHEGALRDGL